MKDVKSASCQYGSWLRRVCIAIGNLPSDGFHGHSQSNMVTDVYSHIVDADRRHLARKMDEHFFRPPQKAKEAADQPPMDESMKTMWST